MERSFRDRDRSGRRKRTSRPPTPMQVDFIDFFNRAVNLGAKFDENAYLAPEEFAKVRL